MAVRSWQEMTDEELDGFILTRLEALGIDLSVLPKDDAEAPADRRRLLQSGRQFLRQTVSAIARFEMDPQEVPPSIYPAELYGRTNADR